MQTDQRSVFNIYDELSLWKYFKTGRFIELLDTGLLHFASARQFANVDKFEGCVHVMQDSMENADLFNDAGYKRLDSAFESLTRLTKVSCWHISEYENSAMWQLYANQHKGIAIITSTQYLLSAIKNFRLAPSYAFESLWHSPVKYLDLSTEELKVSMIEQFFYKHITFQWEAEFRLAISLRMAEEFGVKVPENGIYVPIDLNVLINKIILGPNLTYEDREQIMRAVYKHNLQNICVDSTLTYRPIYSFNPLSSK